ncbi:protein kinase domain containing protein [Stylonychia lemnae]|uniref:non-specific serine/threonine protein kinase n=1 Tax=Stylonychia lemnae TaxID=5949 RepID=A0A078B9I2_STYLE|nr:protein kinase domain containing protein [Stylonychia lemnae]|eukprot:CDW89902.1 protein kinase domain containing protein [Stylonychia lemnae]
MMQSINNSLNQPSSIPATMLQVVDDKIRVHKEIGSGLQSRVFLVSQYKPTSGTAANSDVSSTESAYTEENLFAMKTFEKDEFKALGLREYQLLKNIEAHDNIIKVYNHSHNGLMSAKNYPNSVVNFSQQTASTYSTKNDQPKLDKGFDYMTMEFCQNGDLFNLVKKHGKLSESLSKNLFHQLLNGLEYLHSKVEVAHLDLKLENILVSSSYSLKLCDFGFYEETNRKINKNRGTHGYRAPETYIQSNEGYDGVKADFFSLGVILFIMIFGVPPFNQATREDGLYRLFYRGSQSYKYFLRLHLGTKQQFQEGKIDHELIELLFALMDENPAMRPQSIAEIRQFSYLTKDLISQDEFGSEMEQIYSKIEQENSQQNGVAVEIQ